MAGTLENRHLDFKLLTIAVVVLLACFIYPFFAAFFYIDTGFAFNPRWVVIDVTLCDDYPDLCDEQIPELRIGDRIVKIGDYSFEDYESNRNLALYGDKSQGDSISIIIERDGIQREVVWVLPHQTLSRQLESLVAPGLVFGSFWLAGTVVLLYMRPHSTQWRLLILVYYLTAFWLAAGAFSGLPILYASIVLHAVTWLLLPVYLHLHMIIPGAITRREMKNFLIALYSIAILLAILELAQQLPQYAYTFSIVIIALGSFSLLLYRIFNKSTPQSDKVASRLMVAGIGLAFGPGIIIWLVPLVFDLATPGILATSVALLALPMLPLFYTYAIFKRRLGVFEVRLNRFLAIYSLFIVYLIILSFALVFGNSIPTPGDHAITFYILVILAVILAITPLQDQFRRRVNKLAYGIEFDPDDLYQVYATEISAAVDRETLVRILADEIGPPLGVRQTALLIGSGEKYHPVYQRGLENKHKLFDRSDLATLISISGTYNPPDPDLTQLPDNEMAWVRLSIILERRSEVIGIWLFGARDPDDFYAQKDIDLLSSLAKQVSIAIDNMRLIETVQSELVERKRAEEALKGYADRLELMHEIDQAVLEVGSSKEIAQAALDRLQQLIPFTRGSIVLYEAETLKAELLAVSGPGQDFLGVEQQLPLDLFVFTKDLSRDGRLTTKDVRSMPADSSINRLLEAAGIKSVLSTPLSASGELIGSLNLGSDKPDKFDLEHQDIAQEVANSLAIALHSARLLEAVTGYSDDMKQLSARLINIQEAERKHISYELHDEIGQVLTAISYNLARIRRDTPVHAKTITEERLSDTEELVRQVMDRIRSMSLELRPSMLQDLGLIPTLRWYINQYGNRMEAEVEFKPNSIDAPLCEEIETALYRFVQEGLTNAARHASAKKIVVTFIEDEEIIRAEVVDDGIGFDPENAFLIHSSLSGTGLLGIRERISALGGRVELETGLGSGTKLTAEIPLREQDEKD